MAKITIQQTWDLFNQLIRADNTDITDFKMSAFNQGLVHAMDSLFTHGQLPRDLLSIASGLDIIKGDQLIALPSDYYKYERIAVKSAVDTWINIPSSAIISLEELMNRLASSFYDSSTTGTPTLLAIQDTTSLYFNVYSENYDTFTLESVTGTFTTSDTITGGTSGATATVSTGGTTTIVVTESTITGTFVVGEVVTGSDSGATGTIATDGLTYADGIKMTYFKRPVDTYTTSTSFATELEFGRNWLMLVATAIAATFLYMDDSSEAESKEATLIDLCKTKSIISNPGRLQIARNV